MDRGRTRLASPYTALLFDAIAAAHKAGASDIHVEPFKDGVRLRFRILGDLVSPWKVLSSEHRQSFINEAKRALQLSIAVSGRPQDGRFSVPSLNLDLRVNLLPTLYGEKIVLRLLDLGRRFAMEDLQLEDSVRADLEQALSLKNGVILISGPTGSGKTTTLYTLLGSLDRRRLNIVSIEDPVEYAMDGVSQVKVDAKVTFAGALRAILRQDPDVILVGEIRDEETANLCFKAASTGHLVLSTIHANSASEVVTRLLGLGVEHYLLRSNLRFCAAQRLVKKLCQGCASKQPVMESSPGNFLIAGKGCKRNGCVDGYTGRIVLLEYMTDAQIERFADGDFKGEAEVAMTLREACRLKAVKGVVDAREVDHVG